MTFTSTRIRVPNFFGHKRVTYGTFSNDTTGGTIDTGLRTVEFFSIQHTGNAAIAESPSVNETFPCDRYVKIVSTSSKSGLWMAIGL